MTSPTKRTMDACRQATCGKCPPWLKESRPLVEKVEVFTKYEKTRDLLGFIDVVCYCPPYEIGIQATTGDNMAARVQKICNDRARNAWYWLNCGNTIEVWGWRKYAKPVNGVWWRPRIIDITEDDLHL